MRLLVNGLSVNHLSARHVLYGHLLELARSLRMSGRSHTIDLLLPRHIENNPADIAFDGAMRAFSNESDRESELHVRWHSTAGAPSGPLRRQLWERRTLPELVTQTHAQYVFSPNGLVLPRISARQLTLAQNPWCLLRAIRHGIKDEIKASIQRRAYRDAQRHADLMLYNSEFMRQLYRSNAGGAMEREGRILYQGINEATFQAAARHVDTPRLPFSIVCVSAMAAWKGAETLVQAVKLLRDQGVPAQLRLVGPWPDSRYERRVRETISATRTNAWVTVTGRVDEQQLHREYAQAQVYCLLSRCESFGIPAVEAQAFGTPVVGGTGTAMPEIGGDGGVFVAPGDASAAARELASLLSDADVWQAASERARLNSARFQWERCSRPLVEWLLAQETEQPQAERSQPSPNATHRA